MTKIETLKETEITLKKLFSNYKDKGILSIYLWGSVITPDFNTNTSDIDAVAILSDKAIIEDLVEIRKWLPSANSKLLRLQINFYYLSDLIGKEPTVNNTFRPATPSQAAFDFPHWIFICGRKIEVDELQTCSPKAFLKDQLTIVKIRESWAKNPTTNMDLQYYCKSLVWLCFALTKQDFPHNGFSWESLQSEANENTAPLVAELYSLKKSGWENEKINKSLPFLYEKASRFVNLDS